MMQDKVHSHTGKIVVNIICAILLMIFLLSCASIKPTEQSSLPVAENTEPFQLPTSTINYPTPIVNAPTSTRANNSIKIYSINSANTVKPEDVLTEVYYEMGGGGVSCAYENLKNLKVVGENEDEYGEWLQALPIFVCGWQKEQTVQITVELPNGKSVVEYLQTTYDIDNYILLYVYYPKLGDPEGTYHFTFSGEDGSIGHKIEIFFPSEPRMYYLSPDKVLFFYGFEPNENVRLFYYLGKIRLEFNSWESYQTDNHGNLIVKITPDMLTNGDFISISDRAGLVNRSGPAFANYWPQRPNIVNSASQTDTFACTSKIPTRLKIGDYAFVASNPPLPNRVRMDAGLASEKIGEVELGGIVKIIDGPQCVDNIVWWKVTVINSNLVGWTAEGDASYFLDKCSSRSSCP